MKRSSASVLPLVAAVALVAGCGSSSSSSGSAGGGGGAYGGGSAPTATSTAKPATSAPAAAAAAGIVALTADEQGGLSISPAALKAKAGTVTLKLTNPGANSLPHAIAIEGQGIDKNGAVVQPGGSSTVTAKLAAGTYTFYCPVGSHRANGMEGKLTVS